MINSDFFFTKVEMEQSRLGRRLDLDLDLVWPLPGLGEDIALKFTDGDSMISIWIHRYKLFRTNKCLSQHYPRKCGGHRKPTILN